MPCLDLYSQPFCCFIFPSCVYGLLVQTRSRPYGLCHHPYTLAHIKGLGSFLFCMSMLACFYALGLCWFFLFQALLLPQQVCGCVVTSDTHEALFGYNHLRGISRCQQFLAYLSPFLLRAIICLPCLFVPPTGFLYIVTRLLTCPRNKSSSPSIEAMQICPRIE